MIYLYFLFIFIISHIWFYTVRKYIRGNFAIRLIRLSIINLPYLLLFLYFPIPKLNFSLDIYICLFIMLLVILFRIPDFNLFKLNMKNSFIKFQDPVNFGKLTSRFIEVSLIPIIEEFFYRGSIPVDSNDVYLFSLFSIILFNVSHYIGGIKQLKKHIILLLFSLCSTGIYLYTNNLIYCIYFHILFNFPWIVIHYKNFRFNKKRRIRC